MREELMTEAQALAKWKADKANKHCYREYEDNQLVLAVKACDFLSVAMALPCHATA